MSDALRFRELVIRRMRGFPGGGIQLSGLSAGVNLVHGPNASGKTTTAEALQALLWPAAAPEGTGLGGRLDLVGDDWTVEVDGRRVSWQREGRESSAPSIPPADTRDRYFLSLHGLLRDDDRELAERIRVESAGGYDVPAAAKALDLGAGGRRRSLLDPLAEAEAALDEARQAESALREDRSELRRLHERLDELAERVAELEPLKRAVELARAREGAAEAHRAVDAFPDALARVNDDDLDRVLELNAAIDSARDALEESRRAEARATDELEEIGLGGDPVSAVLVEEVEEQLERARRRDGDAARHADALVEARAVRARAGAALGIGAAGEAAELPDVDAAATDRLDALVREAESVRQERAALEERLRLLDGAAAEPDPSVEKTVDALRQWLRAPEAAPQGRSVFWAAVVSLAVLSGLAVLLGGLVLKVAGAAGLLTVVVLAVLERRGRRAGAARGDRAGAGAAVVGGRGAAGGRDALEQQVRRLGHAPDAWTVDAVQDRLDALELMAREQLLEADRRREIERLERGIPGLEEREAALRAETGEVSEALGLAPTPEDLTLQVVAGRVRTWQEARDREEAAAAVLAAVQRERDALLREASGRLAPYDPAGEVEPTLDGMVTRLSDLRNRRERQAAALADLRAARLRRESAEREREERTTKRADLFSRLGLGPSEVDVLRGWVEQLPDYRDACREAEVADRHERNAREALEVADGGTQRADAPVASLETALEAARAAADEERDLGRRVVRIETRLEQAFGKHDVEEALARVDAARAALADQRDRDIEAEVGAALADWVRARTSDHDRPAVFHRARELFGTITRGRYLLDMPDDSDEATFRARDTTTERGHGLDELSSGTRLQLLLAVRLAFVEEQESGAALPLLLDEVLANCDDHRAGAIIDAAIAIAADGRQVFYFTAQADELSRWRAALESHDGVEWSEHSLAPIAEREGPDVDWQPVEGVVPAPQGRDHVGYGRVLDVPRFDPWGEVGGLHLWYLVEDPDALHQLLAMGISTWGQLDLFRRVAPNHAPGTILDIHEEAARGARLCDQFRELWCQGRGRPVDRAALEASGAVSDVFMERVSELCEALAGDGSELVAALERGDVAGFRSAKTEELRDHLLRHGHLSEEASLDETQIRLTLLGMAARDEEAEPAAEWLDGLLSRLAQGPGQVA